MPAPASKPDAPRAQGLRLGRVLGVELVADWSLALAFLLIVTSLGGALLPRAHPDWSPLFVWSLAAVAACLFFASIVLHELAHALMGRAFGVPTRRITLFVFGGVAHIEREPPSPKAEFLIAVAGPAVSIAVGLLSIATAMILSRDVIAAHGHDPAALVRALDPVSAMLLWLGPTNLTLAVFNLVPGFPLDGGRVLRAFLWWATGDRQRATRAAAGMGQAFAWLLIAAGGATLVGLRVPVLGGGSPGSGLWLMLIGWFLLTAARTSVQQTLLHAALDHVPVRAVMRERVDTVAPHATVAAVVQALAVGSDQQEFPVVEGSEMVGLVTLDDLRRVPRARWEGVTVRDVMSPAASLRTLGPDDEAIDALRELAERDQIPVVEGRRLLGVARRQDILRWLAFHGPEPTPT